MPSEVVMWAKRGFGNRNGFQPKLIRRLMTALSAKYTSQIARRKRVHRMACRKRSAPDAARLFDGGARLFKLRDGERHQANIVVQKAGFGRIGMGQSGEGLSIQ